jgi:UDP-glucose 4-epimerase
MTVVLLTGVTTPLGTALAKALVEDFEIQQVIGVGIEPRPPAELAADSFIYECWDLSKERNIRGMLFGNCRERGVTHVVHSALHRSPLDEGGHIHRLNVESTRHFLRLCERHPTIRRFVFRSDVEVYRHDHLHPTLLREDQPLELSAATRQRVRDRVEADLTVCTRMGMSSLSICVLRLAEVLAPESGSQLYDWLLSRIAIRPLGYNPIVNLLSLDDAVAALIAGIKGEAQGVFNIPGFDSLPLKRLAELAGVRPVALPGPMLSPLYRWRERVRKTEFTYQMNDGRFHTSDLLDGTRAKKELGYEPQHRIDFSSLKCSGPD